MMVDIDYIARELGTLPTSVRAACNSIGIPIVGGAFEWPATEGKYRRLVREIAARPGTTAERLLADLGCKAPRR
ncbi:MAG: hypothetical protein KDJ54_07120 [Candidatus Competibacteraceae bacterium]|nr:hypothetical protein [Candidatus Competibacteraceae bacterium]